MGNEFMKRFLTPLTLTALGTAFWLAGCASSPAPPIAPATAPAAPKSASSRRKSIAVSPTFVDPGPPKVVLSDVDTGEQAIKAKAVQLLESAQYEKLEALAAQYRRSPESFPNGYWKLASVYQGLATVPDDAPDILWEVRRKLIEAWARKKPGSVTAQVALIRVLEAGAYRARGEGWSYQITPAGRQKMDQRIREADAVMRASVKLRKQCPGWYTAAQRVALLESWPRKSYDAVVDEGLRLFPSYSDLHFSRVHYLLPRWFGKPGEMERYAAQVSDRLGGEAGDILYARIVWSMLEDRFTSNILRDTQFSWPRTHKGLIALMKHHPHSLVVASAYAELACLERDRSTAKDLFQNHIKNRVSLNYWVTKAWFVDCRDWALGKN